MQFQAEFRSIDDGKGGLRKITGKPAVYNVMSEDLGGFREIIKPGAFSKTLKERNVKSLWNHDPNYVLGSVKSGTMTIADEADGLTFEVSPPDSGWARDMMMSIDRGDVDQMSFGFRTIEDDWEILTVDGEDIVIRMLLAAELFEVSPVTFPAYPDTSVSLRDKFGTDDKAKAIETLRNLAKALGKKADTHDGNTAPGSLPEHGSSENHAAALGEGEAEEEMCRRRIDQIRVSLAGGKVI
jgi:HK97 family phage prohead protease